MKRRIVLVLSSTALVALSSVLVGCGKDKSASSAYATSVSNRLAAIKQAGQPVTLRELDDAYAAPAPADDATKLYLDAFATLTKDDAQSATFLAGNSKAVKLLVEASKRTACRYPIDLTQGVNTLLPHLANIKKSVQLLGAEAVAQAGRGKTEESCQALIAALRVANSLENEPVLMSQLVRIASIRIVLQSLEKCLSSRAFDDTQLARLKNALPDSSGTASLTRALLGERCFSIAFFQSPGDLAIVLAQAGENSSSTDKTLNDYQKNPRYFEDFDFILRNYDLMLSASDKGFPEALKEAEDAGAMVSATKIKELVVSSMFLPVLGTTFNKTAVYAAAVRNAQTALAIERYRLKHSDALPASLEALVPDLLDAVPTDPFTGKPLSYTKSSGKGYVVYSFGQDKQDDQGSPMPPGGKATDGGDITFSVTR